MQLVFIGLGVAINKTIRGYISGKSAETKPKGLSHSLFTFARFHSGQFTSHFKPTLPGKRTDQ
jgi:hypothetical protein